MTAADPLQLPETAGNPPRRLSDSDELWIWAIVFFATVGVGMWAATLWDGGFAVGLGWAWVLVKAHRWIEARRG